MPIGKLEDILSLKPANARLLGLDIGSKTIGVAVSNTAQTIATPLVTLHRKKKFAQDVEALAALVRDYDIGGFVLGWPLNMDGSEGPACERVRSFADEMRHHAHRLGGGPQQADGAQQNNSAELWSAFWDERLSTASVDDFLVQQADISRTKRKQVVDKLAAQLILQGALDYMATFPNG